MIDIAAIALFLGLAYFGALAVELCRLMAESDLFEDGIDRAFSSSPPNSFNQPLGEWTMTTPNPGSKAALDLGCTCPVLDNSHGLGIYGGINGKDGKPMFWISGDCPIHSMPIKKNEP